MQKENKPGDPRKKPVRGANPMEFATLGGEMAGTAFLGYLIDISFSTIPTWTIVGAILGVLTAGAHLFRIVAKMGPGPGPGGKGGR